MKGRQRRSVEIRFTLTEARGAEFDEACAAPSSTKHAPAPAGHAKTRCAH